MSVEDVDRELRMQERLDALMRVWNIDNGAAFDILWDQCSDHPWSIRQTWADGHAEGEAEDTPTRSTGCEAWEQFHGVTLADAVHAAWVDHDMPLICRACGGDGQTSRWIEPGANGVTDFDVAADERSQTYTDGRVRITRDCVPCKGEGMFMGGES